MRRGVTLLELVIAMAIFTALMVALFQTWLSMRSYSSHQTAAEDLVLESRKLVEEIVTDLGASTWFVPAQTDGGPDTTSTNNELANPALDRSIRYYPYVQVQRPTGVGSEFAAHDRIASGEFISATSFPPRMALLPPEHREASQEIIFLKVRTSATVADAPQRGSGERIDFDTAPPPIAQFRTNRGVPPDASSPTSGNGGGVTVPGIRFTVDAGNTVVDTPLVWDSHVVAPTGSQYREYSYVVVPNPATGKARLERRYRNACVNGVTAPMQLDKVLSENVDRIQFDTYRTLASLNLNQVRVRIWLSREDTGQPGRYLTRFIDITAALRSTSDGLAQVDLQTRLGPGGAFGVP